MSANAFPLNVHKANPADSGRGIVRLDPEFIEAMGAEIGDLAEIRGKTQTYGRVLPSFSSDRGKSLVSMDGDMRKSAEVSVGDEVLVAKSSAKDALELTFHFDQPLPTQPTSLISMLRDQLENVPLSSGDHVRLRLINGDELSGIVHAAKPTGALFLTAETIIHVAGTRTEKPLESARSYEDVGGLGHELARIREMIELPIRRPDIFTHLGIDAPKGVLLSGPPGTGKTLLARAVAEECNVPFFQINGPEIIGKHYGESEKQLRDVFKKAEAKSPSIIFIDELDAIAPKRDMLAGDKQVERRIVAQLLTLLDGLRGRGAVIIMAATNLPDSLDPALRRPGRFDREIRIGVPDRLGRREILSVHTRGMPLHDDVDLDTLAEKTHGYVGADLAALCREAGMAALRRAVDVGIDVTRAGSLEIDRRAFEQAFAETRPSALREVFSEVPDVSWSDVGGLDAIKDTLIEAIVWPLSKPELFDALKLKPAKGAMLSGAPGTGKTLLAKALANEAGVNFIAIRGPQLLNQFIGETERAVRDIFTKARNTAPCILFFDEIDAIAPVRGSGDGPVLDRVVAQFLTEIDGIEDLQNVFLFAATNRVDRVDPALLRPGRFDLVLDMPAPNVAARMQILAIHTRGKPLSQDVDLSALAAKTDGFVGADILGLVQGAARLALKRAVLASETPVISNDHFTHALQEMRTQRVNHLLTTTDESDSYYEI